MRPLLAALAAVAAATTTGGAPAPTTHVERRSIHHKHTPCNPTPHTVEQAPMPPRGCRNAEATSRGPTWPSPSAGPSRRWQEPSTARKGAPSPNPTALHPHSAEQPVRAVSEKVPRNATVSAVGTLVGLHHTTLSLTTLTVHSPQPLQLGLGLGLGLG